VNKSKSLGTILLCVLIACPLVSCNQTTKVSFTPVTTVTSASRAPLPTWTPTSIPLELPTPTPMPFPDASDVCLLYQYQDALWLKVAERPSEKMASPWPAHRYATNAQCPPKSLLPEVEVAVVESPITDTTYSVHLLPHFCIQHPNDREVWFNTEQPLDYGRWYNGDLWRYDLTNNTVEQILNDGQGGQFLQFSPDSQHLILAGSHDIKVMSPDGSGLRQLFEFPEVAICSEINVWVEPIWLPDSSGIVVHIPEGCLHSPDSWPFGLWWVPLEGQAVSIDEFSQNERIEIIAPSPGVREVRTRILDPSPDRRQLDHQRYVYWQDGAVYLAQEGHQPLPLVSPTEPDDGYVAFLCPHDE
jgi:hypothetical protein